MYTHNLIILSASCGKLNQLFTESMSELENKMLAIQNTSNINLTDILVHLGDKDLLVTNDNYIEEKCDYQIINKQGKILLTVNDDGSIINSLEQKEYLKEDECDIISDIYNIIRKCEHICIITDIA